MPIRAGTRSTYAGSMAEAMEEALDAVRAEFGFDPLPSEGRADRQLLFLAIARGVVLHLAANDDAFVIRDHGGSAAQHDDDRDGHVVIETAP
jgi:hypothetical protein